PDAFKMIPQNILETSPRTSLEEAMFEPVLKSHNRMAPIQHPDEQPVFFQHPLDFSDDEFWLFRVVDNPPGVNHIEGFVLERKILRVDSSQIRSQAVVSQMLPRRLNGRVRQIHPVAL